MKKRPAASKTPAPKKTPSETGSLKKIKKLMLLQSQMPIGEFRTKEDAYRSIERVSAEPSWSYCHSFTK